MRHRIVAAAALALLTPGVFARALEASPTLGAPSRDMSAPSRDMSAPSRDMDAATGYRIQNYRSPVTRPVEGGTRISLSDVDSLRADKAILIDVMPARAGYDPRTGKWRLADTRDDIPNSVWLPNVGQGKLEPRLAAYFAASLQRLTGGNFQRPLVFYCMADCWMSWNAVKRAASLGYQRVNWYAEGTDGWSEAGRDLVKAVPPPVPSMADTQ